METTYIEYWSLEVDQGGAIKEENFELFRVVQACNRFHLATPNHKGGQLEAIVNNKFL